MRRIFDEELEDLDTSFTEMGNMVARTVEKAVEAFIAHDRETAQEIIDRDHEINEREAAVEKKTFEMIALYQPVTTDLREIVTILKAVSVLERMGDQARNIAQSTIRMKGTSRVSEIEEKIGAIGKQVAQLVEQTLVHYVADDVKGAEEVAGVSQKITDAAAEIRALSVESMKEDSESIESATDYIVVAAFVKRVSDYATDIAEWIVYKRTGKIIELNPGTSSFI